MAGCPKMVHKMKWEFAFVYFRSYIGGEFIGTYEPVNCLVRDDRCIVLYLTPGAEVNARPVTEYKTITKDGVIYCEDSE